MEELGPRTLLVDDEEPIRQVPLFAARLADYTKHQVGKGGEALRSFQLVQPDLIRLDLDLPDIVGKEVALSTRNRYGTRLGSLREHVQAILREVAEK